jgi:hypothetical protein
VRRPELLLLAGFAAALVVTAILGRSAAPDTTLRDPRASTFLSGPAGASALAEAMEVLGVPVERRRIPLFSVPDDVDPRGGAVLAVIEPAAPLTEGEIGAVVAWIERGGRAILAGHTGIEERLGLSVEDVRSADAPSKVSLLVTGPPGIGDLPPVEALLGRSTPGAGEPPRPPVARRDTLLVASRDRPVAERLVVAGGGAALVLADASWLTNRALRETDVGALVIPWMLEGGVRRLVVDEYHQGFGHHGAILWATWSWLRRSPAGWMMLQLAAAGLVALAVAAFRFGPAVHRTEGRRRSPLEHVDALAAGLERAGGGQTAVALLARGLRRRLRRSGLEPTERGRERWLAALARATFDAEARAAVTRLGWLVRDSSREPEHVLRTAQAVEDVWEALKRPSGRARS